MQAAAKSSCACNCHPCACPSPTGLGCLPDACPPRPCFFNGQLITADDLNAMMTYLRTRDAIFAKMVSGWGVLGGMRLNAGPGVRGTPLANPQLSPNPQILAGTTLTVGAGSAVDVRGRVLTLCAPTIIDLRQLSELEPTTPQERDCSGWFPGSTIPMCSPSLPFAAFDYLIVAVYRERPARPVPQFAGGGACDPAPSCEWSRAVEEVEIRLVPTQRVDLGTYVLTGCLDRVTLPVRLDFDIATGTLTPDYPSDIPQCEVVDVLNEALIGLCCERPAVVIGRVLITASPGGLAAGLPVVPLYTIVEDFRPIRRVLVPNYFDCLEMEPPSIIVGPSSRNPGGAPRDPVVIGTVGGPR